MSLNRNSSREELKDGKSCQSRPTSSNINKTSRPFSANNGARRKVDSVSTNVTPIKNTTSKLGFQKDENFDSLNQQLSKLSSKSVSNPRCLFYSLNDREVEHSDLSRHDIEQARKTGTLKLCRKGLVKVPDLVWSIELPNEEDRNVIDVRFDGKDDKGWWMYNPLEYLDISQNGIKKLAPKGPALNSLRELHANNNEISDISDEIGQCSALKVLTLHSNKLASLSKSITKLTNLSELTLQKNVLQQLPDCIGDLIGLKKLDVSSNQLTEIPLDIGYLTALIELQLSDNQIKSLPEEIQSLRCLTFLDVSNNQLESIPSLNDMSNLTIFSANFNKIKVLPNFYGCHKLCDIRMENNQLKELLIDNLQGVPLSRLTCRKNEISELPMDINRLSTIVFLDISDNKLTKLPVQLVHLRNLTQLLVYGNPIEDVRPDILRDCTARIISHLKHLSVEGDGVNVSSCGQPVSEYKPVYEKTLEHIHEPIRRGVRMTRCLVLTNMDLTTLSLDILSDMTEEEIFRVDLSRNRFSSIPLGLEMLSKNLSEIIIKQNNLTVVPDFIGVMKNLKYLDISNNKVETLPTTMENCNLKELVAEYNCFVEIPPVVFAVESLERISFCGNKISEINVEGLKSLKYLYTLNLSNNNIEKVPPELGHLTQIKELELYGNPFKLPRHSLLIKGTDTVMSYLRDKTAVHDS